MAAAKSTRGTRRAVRRVLLVLAAALALLTLLSLLLILERSQAFGWPVLLLSLGFFTGLAALWIGHDLLLRHFDELERLRGDLLVALGTGEPLPLHWRDKGEIGPEVLELADPVGRLILERRLARDGPDERLAAIVAAAAEGLVVITDSGLVSLVNAAALELLGPERVALGTSIYAALERDSLVAAAHQAAQAGRPIRARLAAVDGALYDTRVAELGEHRGLVISFPGSEVAGYHPAVQHDLTLHDAPPPMVRAEEATPLIELSGLVFDSETTGLDIASARVVSLGAVRVAGRRLYPHEVLDCLVNPGIAIPASATAVHGISDAMVAGAPPLASLLPRVMELLGPGVLIGHNIGFDLAILRREAERAGLPPPAPPTLDTGLLVAALEPDMRELDLERIALRFGVEIEGRHTALGDALVTAEIFLRLIPRLEDIGIRTFGAARAFARAKAERLGRLQRAAGWEQ